MTYPQCPHIKSSPPVPDILLSVRRIERFSVVIGPTGIMSIVAISSPNIRQLGTHRFLENTTRSTRVRRMSHFCLGRYVSHRPGNAKNGGLEDVGHAQIPSARSQGCSMPPIFLSLRKISVCHVLSE